MILVTSNQTLKGWDSKQLHSPPRNIKVNYYISLIRTIKVNYYISLIRAKNVNYYILLTRVKQIIIKHFIPFIQTYINIISLYFFVIIKEKSFNIFFIQNIFDPCIKTKIIFYIFENNIQKENHFFYTKFTLISLTSNKHSKTLKKLIV